MAEERRALHAYLSDEAHEIWQRFAEDNGVSMTGLLEAKALELGQAIANAGDDPTDVEQDWVKTSRRIDAKRRRRGVDARRAVAPVPA